MMWVEKHRPDHPAKMVGNEDVRAEYLKWLSRWKKNEKPALLLGPPGIGKTTLVYAAAKILDCKVIELNASDVRTKEKLERILGPSITSTNLLGERLIIFLDEVDGVYSRQDHGGIEFIYELIAKSPLPLVMAANSEDTSKMKKLMSKSKVLRFKRITPRLIETYLHDVLTKEDVKLGAEQVQAIVRLSQGDIRAAVNTGQALAEAPIHDTEALGTRDRRLSLREALETFFVAQSKKEAREAVLQCNSQARDKVRAFYISIINSSLETEDIVNLLDALSKADELAGEIGRTQEWRLLRYFNEILAGNLFEALPKEVIKYSETEMPWNIQLRVWNEARILREIGLRMAKLFHISSREARSTYLPYMLLQLDKEEVERAALLLGLDATAQRVMVKEAERMSFKVKGS